VFLSDSANELAAAHTAGMQVRLVIRPGNAPVSANHGYSVVRRLDDVSVSD
jgi:methionine salvage enolase-phosphatase E1